MATSPRRFVLGATAVLSLSVCINILQAMRIAALQDTLQTLSARGELSVGSSLPTVWTVTDVNGRTVTLDFKSFAVPTVLYVFSPSCRWCERNSQSVAFLAKHANGYRVVGISLAREGLVNFVERNQVLMPVYTDLPKAMITSYHLGTTPETIVISPDGKVLGDWRGAYTGGTKSVIEQFFSVNLPGIG